MWNLFFANPSQVVGGSSCINGMFFDRGSRHDYDAWRRVGSPDFDAASEKWDWNGLGTSPALD